MYYIYWVAVVANKRFMKIFAPLLCSTQGNFAKAAHHFKITFKLVVLILILNVFYEGFPSRVQLMLSIFRLGLFYNEILLDNVI